MKRALLITALILLFLVEISRVYFIMPFPGSQRHDTISLAYWLDKNILLLRIFALIMVFFPAISIFRKGKKSAKILVSSALALYGIIFFLFNFWLEADKIFYQPTQKLFAPGISNKIKGDKLVIGVAINGEAKANPIQLIGYHHQVRDSVGGRPVIITYCTVCRTGRAFNPIVNGKPETFRLVGMDHFNAMFEDASTKSWWQQATGAAIAGPMKGRALQEIPSQQLKLSSWLRQYPNTTVMQPDSVFSGEYTDMANYDRGNGKSELTTRDTTSWKPKSWIVGVNYGNASKAYDWNELAKNKIIQDTLAEVPLLLTLEEDTASFHVFNRNVNSQVLSFHKSAVDNQMIDNTMSTWNMTGECTDGFFKGEQLKTIQAYQEFWHSWKTFHPNTCRKM